MAANLDPIFAIKGNTSAVRLTTANTTRDLSSTTNAELLVSAATDGTRIDTVTFTHVASSQTQASIATVGRVFKCTSSGGADPRLIKEIALPAITPSASAIGQTQTMTFSPALILNSGEHLWVSISATQTSGGYDIYVNGGDFNV